MKAKIIYSGALLLASLVLLSFLNTGNSLEGNAQDFDPGRKMILTAMHAGFDPANSCTPDTSSLNYSYLKDSLRLNTWHRYGCWFPGDSVDADSSIVSAGVANTLNQNNSRNLRTIFDRPVVRYTCYGQRSDYQCERIIIGEDYWFHSYDSSLLAPNIIDIVDNNFNAGNARVKYCQTIPNNLGSNAGYIVKKLRSNREQINRIIDHTRDDTYPWFVKPRIRIDTAFANDPQNLETRVCRIEIVNWWDSITITKDIRVKNFKENWQPSESYLGDYFEEFYYENNSPLSSLSLQKNQLCPGDSIRAFYDWGIDLPVDFRVYWYGEADMWIDYVRVENLPAKRLLSRDTDLMKAIRNEVNLALTNYNPSEPIPNNFYNEEFEFNMTPCTQFFSKLIDSLSLGKLTMMVNVNMDMYNVHVPHYAYVGYPERVFGAQDFKKYLIDDSKIGVILPNPYFLEGFTEAEHGGNKKSLNPNTLPVYDLYPEQYDFSKGLLTYPASPQVYDQWLQRNLDKEIWYYPFGFKDQMKICDQLSKLTGIQIIDLHQSHMWWQKEHKLKEPTNEELEMTANLALTYGTRGFMYFAYDGKCVGNGYNTQYDTALFGGIYSAGFVDKYKNKRDTNAYGQNKWKFYKNYHGLLEKWEPYIMSFDDSHRNSFIYRINSERLQMSSTTFVNKLRAYPAFEFGPDPLPDFTNASPESNEDAYLQAAFFNKGNEAFDKSQYFMIVNRRCSPFINYRSPEEIGGRRLVTLQSNPLQLEGFNNWKIIDLKSDTCVRVFSKTDTNFVFLGDFLPGEGKLYKLAPVMQEGGTLVTDEDCGGFEFECRGEVNNDGYDITIVPNTTIVFANTSARIVMNGGTFHSGSSSESYPIYLKAKSGSTWRGLNLGNCEEVELHQTHFDGVSPYPVDSTYAVEFTDCSSINISNCIFSDTLTIKKGSPMTTSTLQQNHYSHAEPDEA